MDSEERRQLQELLTIHKRRLHFLEIQNATFGPRTDPATLMEIEDRIKAVQTIEQKLLSHKSITSQINLRELRKKDFDASFRKDWKEAFELLSQL